ncbi:alpha-L-fucosidase [Limisphaera sp. 4302-co]|uniref:alpha-L-fucosidase n=1 Tax=Limisphaera sp. 4302-co TaxID=3400417 RepID=UPI003C194EBE
MPPTGGEDKGYVPPNSAEWMMNRANIPIAEYVKENVRRSNPTNFDARALVRLAREAGMRHLVFTAKHHDGFSMFASKAGHYNVVEATPLKSDVVRELAETCREQGIRFGFCYSQAQDWHHPGGIGNTWDKTIKRVPVDPYVREKAVPEVNC